MNGAGSKRNACTAHSLQQQDGSALFRDGADIGLLSSSKCPCAFGHASRELDMVVHGDDFVVAGCGDDLLCLLQKRNEKLGLVQGPGDDSEATVLNSCVTCSDSRLTWEADPRHAEQLTSVGVSTNEPRWREAARTPAPRPQCVVETCTLGIRPTRHRIRLQ